MRTPDELTELFRAHGRKVTAQRQCIFRVLQGNVTHPSAETVYEAVRTEVATISLKTVYQTLNELAEMGEIASLDLGTGTVRFDPNVDRAHHHLVCRACGKVRDLNVDFAGLSVAPDEAQGYEVKRPRWCSGGCARSAVTPGRPLWRPTPPSVPSAESSNKQPSKKGKRCPN